MDAADPQLSRPVRDADIVEAYRFFFGRDPESPEAVVAKRTLTRGELVSGLLGSDEFEDHVARPALAGRVPSGDMFSAPPPASTLAWAAGFLPLEDRARGDLVRAPSWIAAHAAVLADPRLRASLPGLAARLPLDALGARLRSLAADLGGRSVVGEVEEATRLVVRGHAFDANAPEDALGVELWIDDRFVAASRADRYDRELQARLGGSGRHAFAFEGFAPPAADEERTVHVEVRESGSKLALGGRTFSWRPVRDPGHLAALVEELRAARRALTGIERTLQLVSGAMGFTLESYDAYRRAYGVRTPAVELREAQEARAFAWRPRFDVYVTGSARDAVRVEATLQSVQAQIHPAHAVHVTLHGEGAETAPELEGDYGLLLDAGDALAPDALHRIAAFLQAEPRPALVTIDSDTVEDGVHRDPVLRGAFDPDLLLQEPAVGPTAAVATDVLRRALAGGGSLAPARRGDLWLRVLEASRADAVRHLPRVLLHRALGALAPDREAYAQDVAAHLERTGSRATVETVVDLLGEAGPAAERLRVAWPLPPATRVAVIVPTRDRLDLLGPCLASLEATRGANAAAMEIVVVDNGSAEATTRRTLDALDLSGRIRLLTYGGPFNWSAINNFAARAVEAEVLVFLNNDTVVLTPGWLDELCAQALRPEVGAVGARLLYEDGTIQHAGIVLGTAQALAAHEGAGAPASEDGYLGRRGLVHRAAAVTGACLATRAELFGRLGGFDEAQLAVEANDIDYCLRVRHAGLAVLYDPRATLYHFESRSRGHTGLDPALRRKADMQLEALERRWGEEARRDPWYNPHFDRLSRPFLRLGPPPEL